MIDVAVSIVIPTHNRRELLREMLSALSQQIHPASEFEVIVVADGCTDGTHEMLDVLTTPYRLRAMHQEQGGPAQARNRGARSATGRLLLFLDDDLLPHAQLVNEHARIHQEYPEAVVLGRLLPYKTRGKKGWHIWEEQVFKKHYRAMENGRRPPAGRRLYSGNFSVPRHQFLQAGGFDERLKRGEDVELGFRLQKMGLHFYFNPKAAATHRGYRSFSSWCNSSYLYGRCDVLLAVEKGHKLVLPEISRWYHRQPAAARWMAELCLGRDQVHHLFLQLLRIGAGALSCVGLNSLAHYGYSGIYKLQYWQGVADELGGREAFRNQVTQWRLAWLDSDLHLPTPEVKQ